MNQRPERRALDGWASRLPLRVRLVAGFVLAMSVLLTAAGAFVYWRVRIDLDSALDRRLSEEFAAIEPLVDADGRVLEQADVPIVEEYQTLSSTGEVISAGDGLSTTALLTPDEVARAMRERVHVQIGALLPASPHPIRVLGAPISGHGEATVLAVGVQRDQRDEALRELLATLFIAGAGALLIAAIVGDRLARAALAPVERYRAQAATIAAGATGVRLDVPPSRDDEVTRLGHTFNEVLGALEQALERERRFVHDASHELRTPLTLLTARIQLQQRRARSVDEHERALAELETDIRHLVSLSDQLLELGTSTDNPSDADQPVALHDVMNAMHLDDLGVQVRARTTDDTIDVPVEQVRQIIANVVANASVHGRPPIAATVRRSDGIVVLTVTDAGKGMAPEFIPLAIERFTRGDAARGRPGTGLGLALVDSLVRRHSGEMRLCAAGVHHRVTSELSFECDHPTDGMTVTVAFIATARRGQATASTNH